MAWTRIVFRLLRCCWQRIWHYLFNKNSYGRRKQITQEELNFFPRHPPKPAWVKKEIIRLKALMPNEGHRKVAFAFNRLYSQKRKMTVGRTFVGYTIRDHQYEILVQRRKIKHRKPKSVPIHLIWALDLTGKTDLNGKTHNILGVIEHQSRCCLTLSALTDKSTITLIKISLDLIDRYQKPKIIRTDNEAVFTSRLFSTVLWLMGIKHQRTEIACPWMNGRIEHLFDTLKEKLNLWEVTSTNSLNHSLHLFQFWYHVRPHQYLDGLMPAEVW